MHDIYQVLYIPRTAEDIVEDVKINGLNRELREQLYIVDTIPLEIQTVINRIIDRLLLANELDPKIYKPEIYVSADSTINAAMLSVAKTPALIINKGLLEQVTHEDELAGVIAHELGHLIIDKYSPEKNEQSKVQETEADQCGVKLLYQAKYNPHGINFFLNHIGGNDAHAVSLQDIEQAKSLDDAIRLIQKISDPHPSEQNRIRTMELHIVALARTQGAKICETMTELGNELSEPAKTLNYQTPIKKALASETIKYDNMSTINKLKLIEAILEQSFPPKSRVENMRLEEILGLVKQLNVNFNDIDEKEAFNCVVDVLVSWDNNYGGHNWGIFQGNRNNNSNIKEEILCALEALWSKAGLDLHYFSRNEGFKQAVDGFINSKSKDEAEHYARMVYEYCDQIYVHDRATFDNEFYCPRVSEIKNIHEWIPPYSQHVLWCKETNSKYIKKVLYLMDIQQDPWAKAIMEPAIKGKYRGILFNKYVQSRAIQFAGQENTWVTLERNEAGLITNQIQSIPAFSWPYFAKELYEYQLKPLQEQANLQRVQYEQELLKSVPWDLLSTNFPKFIIIYGKLLQRHYSLAVNTCPFEQAFYAHLLELLPSTDKAFQQQVQDFFFLYQDDKEKLPSTVYRLSELIPETSSWPYCNSTKPNYHTINDPYITFLLDKKSHSVINDMQRVSHTLQANGFIKNSDAKLCDMFAVNISKIVANYPQNVETFDQLSKLSTEYNGLCIAIEAERLAYLHQGTISFQDYILAKKYIYNIEHIIIPKITFEQIRKSSTYAFIDALESTILEREFSSESLETLVEHYKMANAYMSFINKQELQTKAQQQIQKVVGRFSPEIKIKALLSLFEPTNYPSYGTYSTHHDGAIVDPEFRAWVMNQVACAFEEKYGKDDCSEEYQRSLEENIDAISEKTSGFSQHDILSAIATKINAQRSLAYYMKEKCELSMQKTALNKTYQAILLELFINESGKDPLLRQYTLNFLKNPLTVYSCDPLVNHIQSKHAYRFSSAPKEALKYQLQNYHRNFRASSLELKTAYLNPILFPTNIDEYTQKALIENIISEIFATNQQNIKENNDNQIAQEIIRSYNNATNAEERMVIVTALFVANMREQSNREYRVGEKLKTILSNMGPAGGKLLQAIHSYPQTPEDIREDLAHAKMMYSPPNRWELIKLLDDAKLLDESDANPNPVAYIGELKGAGSFGVTVFNRLRSGEEVSDTVLRPFADETAAREFNIMHKAAQDFVVARPKFEPIIPIIQEAQESAKIETDMSLAARANALAEQSYNTIIVRVGNKIVTHNVMQLHETGNRYKRTSIALGQHFNELDTNAKKPIAKAMVATQLFLRLHGMNTDLDRHGGNIKCQNNEINHFDFGAMNMTAISDADKAITGVILAQTVKATFFGEDFSKAFYEKIQNAKVSKETRKYLSSLNKDFLALGDYLHCLNSEERANLVAKCLNDPSMDPQIREPFNTELGIYRYLVKRGLKSKAHCSAVRIFHYPEHKTQEDKLATAETLQAILDCDNTKIQTNSYCPGAIELAMEMHEFEMVELFLENQLWLTDTSIRTFLDEHCSMTAIKPFFKLIELKMQPAEVMKVQELNNLRAEYLIKYSDAVNKKMLPYDDVDARYQDLFTRIKALQTYGEELNKQENKKGNKAINLAQSLNKELRAYIQNPATKDTAIPRISALINKGKSAMQQDRRALDIIAHIALALTGLGLAALLVHKAIRGTFFLNRTRRERLLLDIEHTDMLPKKPRS